MESGLRTGEASSAEMTTAVSWAYRTKIVLDPVEEVRHRAGIFGYRIQPFAYSKASMAIRAPAAATPLQKANRGDGSGITGTLLRLFAVDKELRGRFSLLSKSTNYVK